MLKIGASISMLIAFTFERFTVDVKVIVWSFLPRSKVFSSVVPKVKDTCFNPKP